MIDLGATAEEISIRPWVPADAARGCEIVRSIGSEILGEKLHTWDEAFDSPNGNLWTAELAGQAAGFGCANVLEKGVVLLHSDVVDPAAQRQGIGSALTLLRLAILDEEEVSFVVLQSTDHSRPFYERFGFRAQDDQHIDPVSKVPLRWMSLKFSAHLAESAQAALGQAGVKTPLDQTGQL